MLATTPRRGVLAWFAALPRDARDTLFLLLVIAWVLLPQVANLPWWCSMLAGGVLLLRGWLATASRRLPVRASSTTGR